MHKILVYISTISTTRELGQTLVVLINVNNKVGHHYDNVNINIGHDQDDTNIKIIAMVTGI